MKGVQKQHGLLAKSPVDTWDPERWHGRARGVLGVAQIAVPGVGDEERILLRGVLCCFIFTRVVGRLEGVPSSFCIARGPGNWPE